MHYSVQIPPMILWYFDNHHGCKTTVEYCVRWLVAEGEMLRREQGRSRAGDRRQLIGYTAVDWAGFF